MPEVTRFFGIVIRSISMTTARRISMPNTENTKPFSRSTPSLSSGENFRGELWRSSLSGQPSIARNCGRTGNGLGVERRWSRLPHWTEEPV